MRRQESDVMASQRPSLPARRAFIVQLHTEAQVEQGAFKGRVEHLVSHRAVHFESLEELLAFIVQTVTQPPPGTRDTQGQ
jgi:hypothetical protein